jgi:hypothetical protein
MSVIQMRQCDWVLDIFNRLLTIWHIETETDSSVTLCIVRPENRIVPVTAKAEESALSANLTPGVDDPSPNLRVG